MAVSVATLECMCEPELMTCGKDTRLFWVFRDGRMIKRTWNELTRTEQQQQREAEARAVYVATFDIY